jgi:hypothetical protein
LTVIRAPARALALLVATTMVASSPSARADEAAVLAAPVPTEHTVLFEKPTFWPGWGETWTLRDPSGKVACELPCAQTLGPSSGYFVEGVQRRYQPPEVVHVERIDVRIPRGWPPGGAMLARPVPERGNLGGTVVLGVFGSIALTGATLLLVAAGSESNDNTGCSSCMGVPPLGGLLASPGAILAVMGVGMGVGAISLGIRSSLAKVVISSPPPASPPAPAEMRVSLSPTGIVVTF